MAQYKDYSKRGNRTPLIAWFMDRSAIYATFIIVSMLTITGILATGFTSLQNLRQPPPDTSPYQEIEPDQTKGNKWAQEFVSKSPLDSKDWNANTTRTLTQPIDFKTCEEFGLLPSTIISTHKGRDKNTELTLQLYNPGQAKEAFDQYKEKFSKCWETNEETRGLTTETTVINYDDGFFFTYGDAIFFIKTKNEKEPLKEWYLNEAEISLKKSGCSSLTVTNDDKNRNLYVNNETYTGLIAYETIETTLNLTNIPTPKYQEIDTFIPIDEPEGPLPENFPLFPKEEPEKPQITGENTTNTIPEFKETVSYQIPDDKGPGCGWDWSGQKPPKLDKNNLSQIQYDTVKTAQFQIDKEAGSYAQQKIKQVQEAMLTMVSIEKWNSYVNEVRNVYEKWNWLENERNKIEYDWRNYVKEYNEWINFDNKKANSLKTYNAKVEECNAADNQLNNWTATWEPILSQYETELELYNTAKTNYQNEHSAWAKRKKLWEESQQTPTPPPTEIPTGDQPIEDLENDETDDELNEREENNETEPPQETTEDITPRESYPEPGPEPTFNETPPTKPEIPEKPTGCIYRPVEPNILSEEKPNEPTPPNIPEDVTIPTTWPKPLSEPNVRLN